MTRTFKSTDKASYTLVEDGTYEARFKGWEEIELEFGPCAKMFFEIETDQTESGEEEISGIASLPKGAMGPRSKLRQWLEGLRGRPFAEGEEVDLDTLIDAKCRLMIGTKDTIKKDGTKGQFNTILKVLPPRGKKAAVKAAPVTDDEMIV